MTKSRLLAAAVVIAALSLTACSTGSGAEPSASDETPFDFVYLGGVTGGQASLSQLEVAALNVAVDEINGDGGILGRQVEMEIIDTKSDPTEAVSVLQRRLAAGDPPDLVRAGLSSTEALALLPVTTRAGIPTFSGAGSPLVDDTAAYPFNKLTGGVFSRYAELMRTWVENEKFETVAVLAPEDASGDSTVAAMEKVFEGSSSALDVFRFNPADLDLSVAYQRAIEKKPDLVYANCLGAPCVRVVAARESVAGGTDIPMFGDASMSGSAGGPAAGVPPTAIENLHVLIFDGQLKKAEKDQTEAFKVFYSGLTEQLDPTGLSSATIAYDGLRMYAAAAEKAKSVDAQKMIDAINENDWPAGYFVTYGKAKLTWNPDHAFPQQPDDAFAVVQVGPLEGGLYPPLDVFQPKVKGK
jgi:branched-chain amino acid transport system substrate-binding protein